MKITLGEEKIVAIGPRYEDSYWGQWQFPKLMEGKDGQIVMTFHNAIVPKGYHRQRSSDLFSRIES